MNKPTRGRKVPFAFPFTDHSIESLFMALFAELQQFNLLLGQQEVNEIIACCEVVVFKKNDLMLDYGEICRHVYFAGEGLVAAMFINDGREKTCWYMAEGNVIIAIDSFYNQAPSEERLQALEQTTCVALHIEHLTTLTKKYPEFLWVENMLTRRYYQQASARAKWVHCSAADRYALLLENYPNLNNRVSDASLASYLGISKVHFSRIKCDYLKNGNKC